MLNKFSIIISSFIALLLIIFFTYRYFAPFGTVVNYQFSSILNQDKASELKGASSNTSFTPSKDGILQLPQQIIRTNTATFNLKIISKPIEGIWVNLKFKGNPKEIKIGVRGSDKDKYYYKPLYNRTLESLTWKKIIDGNTVLWQKEKNFDSLGEFISKPQLNKTTISYFFDSSKFLERKDLEFKSGSASINKVLRGTHTFYTYVTHSPFILKIEKQDLNAYDGEDNLLVQVFRGDIKIEEKKIPDDGVRDGSRLKMPSQSQEIKINDAKKGIYKVVLNDKSVSSDILIKKIEASQSYLVFSSPIFILDDKPTTLWTDSEIINMVTAHSNYVQTVKLDGRYDLKIQKEGSFYTFDLNSPNQETQLKETTTKKPIEQNSEAKMHKLYLPKNNLNINGDGAFSFDEKQFFKQELFKSLSLSTELNVDKADYIVAGYTPVKKEGDRFITQVYFDPKDIKIDQDKLYFSLESPTLEDFDGEIIVDNLEVTVNKPGWFKAPVTSFVDDFTSNVNAQKENVFVGTWNKITGFFKGIFNGIFQRGQSQDNKISTEKKSPTPVKKPSPTAKPATVSFSIVVANAGAKDGAAGKFAGVLKLAGFSNVEINKENLLGYKDVLIKYKKEEQNNVQKIIVGKIRELLKKDYDTVKEDLSATKSGIITIILGQEPTKTVSPSATITPTKKP